MALGNESTVVFPWRYVWEGEKMATYPGNYFLDIHPSHFKLAKESSRL